MTTRKTLAYAIAKVLAGSGLTAMTTGNAWLAVSGMAVIVITITTGIVLAFMAMG